MDMYGGLVDCATGSSKLKKPKGANRAVGAARGKL
jgi:hypothetical protein